MVARHRGSGAPPSRRKPRKPRRKIVVRDLPPHLPASVFWSTVSPWVRIASGAPTTDDAQPVRAAGDQPPTVVYAEYIPGKRSERCVYTTNADRRSTIRPPSPSSSSARPSRCSRSHKRSKATSSRMRRATSTWRLSIMRSCSRHQPRAPRATIPWPARSSRVRLIYSHSTRVSGVCCVVGGTCARTPRARAGRGAPQHAPGRLFTCPRRAGTRTQDEKGAQACRQKAR